MDKTQCINVEFPDDLNSYTMKLTSDPIPLLLSISKQATASQLQSQIEHILRISREHRIQTNASNPGSIERYIEPYSTIYVDSQYYTNSVFFMEGLPETPISETPISETSPSETVQEGSETAEEARETAPANSLEFPRFYCMPLSSLSQQTLKPSLLPELSAQPGTLIFHLFATLDAKTDYRCVYVATRVRGLPTASSFLFEGCKDPGSALSSLAQAVRAAPAPIAYTDEQAAEETKNRGKKSAVAEKPKQLQLTDCLELKKPSTVILTGSGWARACALSGRTCQYCRKCSTVVTTPYLCRLPDLLLIQLKRFKYSGCERRGLGVGAVSRKQAFGKEKICTYVEYPVHDFDVTEYLLPSARADLTNPDQSKYELQCVVNHTGGADFGHYYAYCRDGYNDLDNWFEYNDASVSAVREEEVVTKNAYLLLYRRKDLGNAIYTRISEMTILGGKKEDVSLDSVKEKMMKVESEKKLERERKDAVEKEKKEGVEEVKEEKKGKRHMSKEERKLLREAMKAERKAERKRK